MKDNLTLVSLINDVRYKVVNESLPYNVIEQSLIELGYDGRTVSAAIRNAQKFIGDSQFQEKYIYYTTHLARVMELYENLKRAGELSEALKALKEHKETYFLLNSILE